MGEQGERHISKGKYREGDHFFLVPAAYNTKLSAILISNNVNDKFLSQSAKQDAQHRFSEIGKSKKYDMFVYVAKLAEEFAHFVQHTRGKIPGIVLPPKYAQSNEVAIKAHGFRMGLLLFFYLSSLQE